ncbi:hypothetical protein [Blastococcus sp. SYSU D00813]
MSAPAATVAAPAEAPARGAGRDRGLARWLWAGALGSAAAGGLHVLVAYEHVAAGGVAIMFFLLTALAQLGLAGWLVVNRVTGLRPDRRLVTLALAGTVALMGLYVLAHSTGLLDAFAVAHGDGGAHGMHETTGHDPGIDPVTGVDYSTGVAVQTSEVMPMSGSAEPVRHEPGPLGSWTVAAEVLTVAALVALQPAAWRRRTTNVLLGLGALAWALWFTGVLG